MNCLPVNPLDPVPPELQRIDGINKLKRAIQKEISSPNVNEKSSNLPHLLSILKCIQQVALTSYSNGCGLKNDAENIKDPNLSTRSGEGPPAQVPSAVLKPFNYSSGKTGRLIVDIVSADGDSWYKVSARDPKALCLLAAGGGGFGQKSIVDYVYDYLECANENHCLFKAPKVAVIFTSGIGQSLATELECIGVRVMGERIPDFELGVHPRIKVFKDTNSIEELRDDIQEMQVTNDLVKGFKNPSLEGVTKLNLDITALLAFVSNLTNGHSDAPFRKSILADQAADERVRPQKPILDRIFQGRDLFCCETALREFQSILSTVGGPEEKLRAAEFIKGINVVPDQISERTKSLSVSGNIKSRSLLIFGTGDTIKAVTVTANSGFVRSAKTQGIDLAAFVHESRALTEQKEMLLQS